MNFAYEEEAESVGQATIEDTCLLGIEEGINKNAIKILKRECNKRGLVIVLTDLMKGIICSTKLNIVFVHKSVSSDDVIAAINILQTD